MMSNELKHGAKKQEWDMAIISGTLAFGAVQIPAEGKPKAIPHRKDVRPANKSQVGIQEIYAGRNKRTQSCHFASAIKDGGSP